MKNNIFVFVSVSGIVISCVLICYGTVMLSRWLKLKRSRYCFVKGKVVGVYDPFAERIDINKGGNVVVVEYIVNNERYSTVFGRNETGIIRAKYHIGDNVELLYDTDDPRNAFRRRRTIFYFADLALGTILLMISIFSFLFQ